MEKLFHISHSTIRGYIKSSTHEEVILRFTIGVSRIYHDIKIWRGYFTFRISCFTIRGSINSSAHGGVILLFAFYVSQFAALSTHLRTEKLFYYLHFTSHDSRLYQLICARRSYERMEKLFYV